MKRSRSLLAVAGLVALVPGGVSRGQDRDSELRKAVTFFASFETDVKGDFGSGVLTPSTRFNHPTEKGQFVVEKGVDKKVFRIAPDAGVQSSCLEVVDVLPRNGRIFFPAKGNVAFKKGGWSGALSVWCKTDPDKMLKTRFCDPIQITEKGAHDGAIWFDFNDKKPRDLRHGAFTALARGEKAIGEDDPKAPMVRVPGVGWKGNEWHHVVISWKNFDSGKADATSALYIDAKLVGEIKDRPIAMGWDVEKAGVYVGINYIGFLDELVLFDRALSKEEVEALNANPNLIGRFRK
jgi:hypothetical protein